MDYETVASLFSTGGLIYFLLLFAGVLVYALWPGNKAKFDRAARMPLEED
jgi:cytochrome c oxidase cbb3-type subunit 4